MRPPTRSVCLGFAILSAFAASASAQKTTRISVGTGGSESDDDSYTPSLSADGRYVAFYSEATNLVPGDTNGFEDVFVYDRRTGATTLVSVDSAGGQANSASYDAVISADGSCVTFFSTASNLVAGDTNAAYDVFVHDLVTGTTSRVSVDSGGAQANGFSAYPSISGDGRFVAFYSDAPNLVIGDTNAKSDVFVHDRLTAITARVSVDSSGAQGNQNSTYPEISDDGTRVVFESNASNLVAGDTNGHQDVFVHDSVSGLTVRASVNSSGVQGNSGGGGYPAISADGRVVGFVSFSTNLVTGDTNANSDVFVRDLVAGTTTRVSVSSAGVQGNNGSLAVALSGDGHFVVFKGTATNLVPNDTNDEQDIFVRDVVRGTTSRVSVDSHGAQALGRSSTPAISANGRHIGFYSFAPNLVNGDTNGVPDVFVRTFVRFSLR